MFRKTFAKHLIYEHLPYERGQKFVENDPLIVPPQLPGRFVEHTIVRYSGESRFINERIVSLEHGEMELRHQHVRIVARVADKRSTAKFRWTSAPSEPSRNFAGSSRW
jgi:hypothetical protein